MNLTKQIALKLRFIKLQRFLGSLFYPLQRDWLERQVRSQQSLEVFEETGNLLRAEQIAKGARFYFKQVELEIQFLNPDLVRVDWQPHHPPVPYGIARQDWPEVKTTLQEVEDANNTWMLYSDSLKIRVAADGGLEFQDAKGQTLRQEFPPEQQAQRSPHIKGEGWRHQAKLRPEEHIYGLGERAAPLNLRTPPNAKDKARTYRMWNYDAGGRYGPGTDPLYLCIPVYLGLHSQGSYLIFYENSYPATFSFQELAIAEFEGGPLRYYFTAGSPAHLLERYTELTGRSPLPPRWAFGYHQSRWGYEKESALRETAQGFLTHDLPLCAMHLDIDCLDGFRTFTIDPDHFPHLKEFTQELGDRSIQLTASLEELPLWVKAGSIIPTEEKHQLVLHLYPSASGYCKGHIYSDAGDGYGEWRIDHFCLKPQPNYLELTWQQEGDYAFPYQKIRLQVHGLTLRQVYMDGKTVSCEGNCIEIEWAKPGSGQLMLEASTVQQPEPVLR